MENNILSNYQPHILPKITVIYDPKGGISCKDSEAESLVVDLIENFFNAGRNLEVKLGTTLLVDYFRLYMCRGKIGANNIEFKFNDQILPHDDAGRFTNWPNGFCDYGKKVIAEILVLRKDW